MSRDDAMGDANHRRPIQTRRIEYTSFLRDDGLFEIEGKLLDTREASGDVAHDMTLRVVFDGDRIIRSIDAVMQTAPFSHCASDKDLFARLVGEQISPGWKQRAAKKMSRSESCSHQLELLFSMATVAYQATAIAPEVLGLDPFKDLRDKGIRPYFLDGCRAWQADGDLVGERFPDFAEPKRR